MASLEVTAFHLDFSTLDIEKGEKVVCPVGMNYVVKPTLQQPLLQIKGLVLPEEAPQGRLEEQVPSAKRGAKHH